MKDIITKLVLVFISIILFNTTVQKCTTNKKLSAQLERCNYEYAELLKAKQKIDTIYNEGETKYVYKTVFKTIKDTLFVEGENVYKLYEDTLKRPELNLKARIVANDLRSVDYEYSVMEKIIVRENIIYKHDTAYINKRKVRLYMINEFGLPAAYSAGLHLQTKDKIGVTARYNIYKNEDYFSLGLVYRLF